MQASKNGCDQSPHTVTEGYQGNLWICPPYPFQYVLKILNIGLEPVQITPSPVSAVSPQIIPDHCVVSPVEIICHMVIPIKVLRKSMGHYNNPLGFLYGILPVEYFISVSHFHILHINLPPYCRKH